LLVAASAPVPPDGFASGINGLSRGLAESLVEARAAGFDAARVFMRWDKIETTQGAPDWGCRYVTEADLGPDVDGDGAPDPWPGIPCGDGPCGCGYSADERVAMAGGAEPRLPVMLTIAGTPVWARGRAADGCPPGTPGRSLPLAAGIESAYREFVAAVASRYGDAAYAFELWNEPDLPACESWAGTQRQYRKQILSAAAAVKAAGAVPGLVVAPTLEDPSGAAMEAWLDWSAPIDLVSFNLYTTSVEAALAKIDEMNAWCRGEARCPGFYITEMGAPRFAPRCPGPSAARPGPADVAMMARCRHRRRCAGFFVYTLSDQDQHRECDRGLIDVRGCPKRRLCTIARHFFGRTTLPFDCRSCGP
jgi:hypothetical protein